jgi:hypothetical protein
MPCCVKRQSKDAADPNAQFHIQLSALTAFSNSFGQAIGIRTIITRYYTAGTPQQMRESSYMWVQSPSQMV